MFSGVDEQPSSPTRQANQQHGHSLDWLQSPRPKPHAGSEGQAAVQNDKAEHSLVAAPLITAGQPGSSSAGGNMPLQEGAAQVERAQHSQMPLPAPGTTAMNAATVAALKKAGFESRDQALAWLAKDGYDRARSALEPLGITCGLEVALLQAHQIASLTDIKPVTRKKIVLILEELVSDGDRVQMVFEQHGAWLQESLEMDAPGKALHPLQFEATGSSLSCCR